MFDRRGGHHSPRHTTVLPQHGADRSLPSRTVPQPQAIAPAADPRLLDGTAAHREAGTRTELDLRSHPQRNDPGDTRPWTEPLPVSRHPRDPRPVPATPGGEGPTPCVFRRASRCRTEGLRYLRLQRACRNLSKPKILELARVRVDRPEDRTAAWWGATGLGNLDQRNTPLVTEECEGQVTVTDPCHPLYGRTLKLSGLARLPGHVRHCQVEVLPGQIATSRSRCTDLSTEPRPEPTVLTLAAIEELVAAFQAVRVGRRCNHATRAQPSTSGHVLPHERTRRRHRGDRPRPHGGGGE